MTLIESHNQLKEATIWLGFYDHSQLGYRCVTFPDNIRETCIDPLLLREVVNVKGPPPRPEKLRRYEKSFLKKCYHTKRLDFAAFRNKSKPFKKFGLTPKAWKSIRSIEKEIERRKLRPTIALEKIINKNDKIVLIDNTLQHENIVPCLIYAKDKGCQILTFVHDLIPIFEPWFVSADGSERFYQWLKESTKFTSLYVTNSHNTLKDLEIFMKSQRMDIKRKAIPLAQQQLLQPKDKRNLFNDLERDVLSAFTSSYNISPRIRSFAKSPFVLAVGTKEVRKNLWRVATAWDAIVKQKLPYTPKLIVVGKQGWSNDDFDALLQGTGSLGGWLEVVENASDVELDWLYERCVFTIFASMYEVGVYRLAKVLGTEKLLSFRVHHRCQKSE